MTMRCSLLMLCAAAAYADVTNSEIVVGIDLGATNFYIAAYRNGQVEMIVNEQGNRMTPSRVAFIDAERHTGEAANEHTIINPEDTVFNVKRLLEKKWGDKTVEEDVKDLSYKNIERNNKPHVYIEGVGEFSAEEITAMMVKKIRDYAETYAGTVTYAVVSVPTHFNDAQRQATKKACEIAGLKILRVITDPIAAAVAYGFDVIEGEKNVLVFDIGGTTFDVSILNIDNGVIQIFATGGDIHLGGKYFDQRVIEYFKQLYKERGVHIDNKKFRKLRFEIEEAKKRLSSHDSAKLEMQSLSNGGFSDILTRDQFEELNMDLFNSTLTSVKGALKDAEMSIEEIDEIILVGGSTNIPKIQQLLREFFDKEPSRSIKPDEVVAYGAALFADKINKEPEPPVYISMNPLTIGIETVGGIMTKLIPRNTITPTKQMQVFSTAYDNQMTVTIKIYEGERLMTKNNHLLGKFDLVITPLPKGKQIEVTLEIDANEVLVVTAEDKQTGVKKKIVIENNPDRWTDEYIEEMMLNAKMFAGDYEKAREKFENTELLLEGHRHVEFEEIKELIDEQERRVTDEL